MTASVRITLPWPRSPRGSVYPIFLPFLGCPHRCIFCSQQIQTGISPLSSRTELQRLFRQCERDLLDWQTAGREKPELAFYGGTFTGVRQDIWKEALKFAETLIAKGLIGSFRCSTRPDELSPQRLRDLSDSGCKMIELGIQSFKAGALAQSGRGYTPEQAREGCARVKEAGFLLGVQFLPGMPGHRPEDFSLDVEIGIQSGSDIMRFYPCLVFPGSGLACLWQEGAFIPWSISQTIASLGEGYLLARISGIPVIRIGVAPTAGLEEQILAGPWHPALGSRVMGAALLRYVRSHTGSADCMYLPQECQGYVWGWHKELKAAWRQFEADLFFWPKDMIVIEKS